VLPQVGNAMSLNYICYHSSRFFQFKGHLLDPAESSEIYKERSLAEAELTGIEPSSMQFSELIHYSLKLITRQSEEVIERCQLVANSPQQRPIEVQKLCNTLR
jgi:hypothetical protein